MAAKLIAARLMATQRRARNLRLEQLEGRQLMAGIVNVTFTGNELRLEAVGLDTDPTPNGVVLTFTGNGGSTNFYRVSSTNTGTPNDPGTQFRIGTSGPTFSTLNLPGVPNTADLYVKLKNGDDKFVYNQSAPVTVTAINFRDAAIDLGFGAKDTLETTFLRVSQDWKIWGGQPGTPPQIQAPVISIGRGGFNSVGRDFCYFGGNGNDDITMLATNIALDVRRTPDPANYTAPCPLQPMFLNDGNDRLTISNSPTGQVTIGLPTSTATNSVFYLDTGLGNDAVSSTGMDVNAMVWNLNDGDDTVFFQSTDIRWNSTVDGGVGYDLHTESTSNPRNNFKDANGDFILDGTATTPTPPFTTPSRQGTATNPNGAELRFVNFENGQTRPPVTGGGGGGGGGVGGGGRWTFRRGESVVVDTANSSNLTNLQNILVTEEPSAANNQASARIVDDRLVISGTSESDVILVSNAGQGLVSVRVGNRVLGTFPAGLGIGVETFTGDDLVYVAPSIQVSTMVSGTAARDLLVGGQQLMLLDSGTVYSNQQAAEHPQFVLEPSPAQQDLALLQILGLPADVSDPSSVFGRAE